MEYHGNLYAKIGGKYFKLDETSDDIDKLRDENDNLKLELSKYEKRYPSKIELSKEMQDKCRLIAAQNATSQGELTPTGVLKAVEFAISQNETQEQTLTEIRRIQRTIRDSGKNMNYTLTINDNEIKFGITISFGFDILFDEDRNFNACDFKTNIESLQHFISIFDFKKYI